MTISTTKLSDACGAEISGVDLRMPLSSQDAEDIHRAWLDHLVIVFRGQHLEPEDQQRFGAYFGNVGAYYRPREAQHPQYASDKVMLVSNIREGGKPIGAHPDGEMMWHTDTAYKEHPHKATTLYAVEVPDTGGNTLFSNQYLVYDALRPELKTRLGKAVAVNAYAFGTTVKTFEKYDRTKVPHYAHPVFRKHPETGRPAVYVCPLMTEEIVGIDPADSKACLEEIYAIQRRPEFIYSHVWRPGDLVMWDNRCLMHAREDFPPHQRRLLRRVTIADDAHVLAA